MNLGIPYGTSKINFIPMSEVKHSQGLHPSQANLGSQERKGFRQLMKTLMVHKHGSFVSQWKSEIGFHTQRSRRDGRKRRVTLD